MPCAAVEFTDVKAAVLATTGVDPGTRGFAVMPPFVFVSSVDRSGTVREANLAGSCRSAVSEL